MKTLILVLLVLAACTPAKEQKAMDTKKQLEEINQKLIEVNKDIVRAQLKDPDAAKFQNVRFANDGQSICGSLNAKNAYGGYIGYLPFVVVGGDFSVSRNEEDSIKRMVNLQENIGC